MNKTTYWVYRTKHYQYKNKLVRAELIDPDPHSLSEDYVDKGFKSPLQSEPYLIDLKPIFRVNKDWSHPDNYAGAYGFDLYSERLIGLMNELGVKNEKFPAKMVDNKGNKIKDLTYFVFHSLEGIQDAMDEGKSKWTGDYKVGIPTLVLDYDKFVHRPIFVIDKLYCTLMRDDLKKEIEKREITGFEFLSPEKYTSGSYGLVLKFED